MFQFSHCAVCLQSGTHMQIMKKVLSAIRNSNADNEKGTSAIRISLKKHDTLYSACYPDRDCHVKRSRKSDDEGSKRVITSRKKKPLPFLFLLFNFRSIFSLCFLLFIFLTFLLFDHPFRGLL